VTACWFQMGHLYVKYEPEVTVIIKLIIWQVAINSYFPNVCDVFFKISSVQISMKS